MKTWITKNFEWKFFWFENSQNYLEMPFLKINILYKCFKYIFLILLQQNVTLIIFVQAKEDKLTKTVIRFFNINNWFFVLKG